jgi:hyperosmotically inducible protein
MIKPSTSPFFFAVPALLLSMQVATGQSNSADTTAAKSATGISVAPDNTNSNRQDPSNMNQSADAQMNDAADVQITQRIRRNVIADKSLSSYAHNVKIVTANGLVTLNGVVRSDDEKAAIGMQAASVVGKDHVVNEIKVAPQK